MSGVQQKVNSRHITWSAMLSSFPLHHFYSTAQAATRSDTVQQQQGCLYCRYSPKHVVYYKVISAAIYTGKVLEYSYASGR